MGERAQAATAAAAALAYQGTRGSPAAIHSATTSRLMDRAHCLARPIKLPVLMRPLTSRLVGRFLSPACLMIAPLGAPRGRRSPAPACPHQGPPRPQPKPAAGAAAVGGRG